MSATLTGVQLGPHRVDDVIGEGGMGVVYEAWHTQLDRREALKVILPKHSRDASFRERFKREGRAVANLQHPNVITVYDAQELEGHLFIAMQFVEGSDLARFIEAEGPLDSKTALALVGQAARALDAAHATGLVHRDVKPANMLIGPKRHVYVSDFGLAKSIERELTGPKLTQTWVGTPHYAAPEQLKGKPLDARADVYALGVVLFEALSGHPPFDSDSFADVLASQLLEPPPAISTVRDDLPAALDGVLKKALAKAPDDRYDSCGEFVTAARAVLRPPKASPRRQGSGEAGEGGGKWGTAAAVGAAAGMLLKGWLDKKAAAPAGAVPRPSPGPAAALPQLVVGAWDVHMAHPNGWSGSARIELAPNFGFRATLYYPDGTHAFEGTWRIPAPGQLVLEGQLIRQQSFGVPAPWAIASAFSTIEPHRLAGRTPGGEEITWTRVG